LDALINGGSGASTMQETGFVKISPTRSEYLFEINFQFPIQNHYGDKYIFRFPYHEFSDQAWFIYGNKSITTKQPIIGDLIKLKLDKVGNMVFESALQSTIVQGGVILTDPGSRDSYRIEFGFVV